MACWCKPCVSERIVRFSMSSYYEYLSWKTMTDLTRDPSLREYYQRNATMALDSWLGQMGSTLQNLAVGMTDVYNSSNSLYTEPEACVQDSWESDEYKQDLNIFPTEKKYDDGRS